MPVQETIQATSSVSWSYFLSGLGVVASALYSAFLLHRKETNDSIKEYKQELDRLAKESISEERVRRLVADKIEPFQRVQENTLTCVTKMSNDLTDYMRAQGENGVRVRDLERRMDKSEDKGG